MNVPIVRPPIENRIHGQAVDHPPIVYDAEQKRLKRGRHTRRWIPVPGIGTGRADSDSSGNGELGCGSFASWKRRPSVTSTAMHAADTMAQIDTIVAARTFHGP